MWIYCKKSDISPNSIIWIAPFMRMLRDRGNHFVLCQKWFKKAGGTIPKGVKIEAFDVKITPIRKGKKVKHGR